MFIPLKFVFNLFDVTFEHTILFVLRTGTQNQTFIYFSAEEKFQ